MPTGILTDWKDDKGFGFVTPVGAGARVFVHVSSFGGSARRPRVGDRLTYEVDATSAKGPRAVQVRFAEGEGAVPGRALRLATVLGVLAVAGITYGVAKQGWPAWILFAMLLASALSLTAYGIDKQAAIEGRWRVPEDVLHAMALLGGWPGAAIAQQWLRHKSSKRAFQVAYWVTVAIHLAVVAWLVSPPLRRATGFSF